MPKFRAIVDIIATDLPTAIADLHEISKAHTNKSVQVQRIEISDPYASM
jgi:hypothetical protein